MSRFALRRLKWIAAAQERASRGVSLRSRPRAPKITADRNRFGPEDLEYIAKAIEEQAKWDANCLRRAAIIMRNIAERNSGAPTISKTTPQASNVAPQSTIAPQGGSSDG